MKQYVSSQNRPDSGFTLIELMVALAVSGIVTITIATAYRAQTKANTTNNLQREMQQTLRAAMMIMKRDIVMAGYRANIPIDDFQDGTPGITVNPTSITIVFSDPVRDQDGIDNDSDGDIDEENEKDGRNNDDDSLTDESTELITITYNHVDSDGDGANDRITRISDPGTTVELTDIIAEDIERVNFNFILAQSQVEIALLARTAEEVDGHFSTATYAVPGAGVTWGPFNDSFQRRFLTSTVFCRNLSFSN
ncbi:MAG: prepilin-type N-terminal cleavage/methylation domain-containing protein [Thermodesulfobacteriota bacterium]|nr:prepilin-type N-terminal cleavage/methylation domain-containing protein [Thermodesulfobacteriota bacterium]